MLTIKLSKVGKTHHKMFRLIISEKRRDTFGRSLEILGSYNPYSKEFQAKADRIKYWLSKGAQMTPTVNNLLIDQKIIEGEKVKASKVGRPKKGEEKTEEISNKEKKKEAINEKKTEEKKEETVNKEKTEETPEEEKSRIILDKTNI